MATAVQPVPGFRRRLWAEFIVCPACGFEGLQHPGGRPTVCSRCGNRHRVRRNGWRDAYALVPTVEVIHEVTPPGGRRGKTGAPTRDARRTGHDRAGRRNRRGRR